MTFIKPKLIKRFSKTVSSCWKNFNCLTMVLSTLLALLLQNAMQLFNLLLVFGAGTGLSLS